MSRNKNKSRGGKDTMVLEFHSLLTGSFSSGAFQASLNPTSLGSVGATRLLAEADAWAHFRYKTFRFRLRVTPSTVNQQAAGYVGGVQDTPPATVSAVVELLPSAIMDVDQTIPSEWVSVPRADLAGCFPWYKAVPGSPDPTEETPGTLVVCGASAEGFAVEIRAIIEFKTAVATANTPMALQARALVRAERIRAAQELEARAIRTLLSPPAPTRVAVPTAALMQFGA